MLWSPQSFCQEFFQLIDGFIFCSIGVFAHPLLVVLDPVLPPACCLSPAASPAPVCVGGGVRWEQQLLHLTAHSYPPLHRQPPPVGLPGPLTLSESFSVLFLNAGYLVCAAKIPLITGFGSATKARSAPQVSYPGRQLRLRVPRGAGLRAAPRDNGRQECPVPSQVGEVTR